MEEEFKTNPESTKPTDLATYVRLYATVNPDKGSEIIQKEIESKIKSGLKDEDDYSTLQNLYSLAKLPEQAKLINDLKEQKFPNGKWQINEAINKFLKEKDLDKKKTMFDDISR